MSSNFDFLVLLEEPSKKMYSGVSKKQKFYLLKGYYEHLRSKILDWVEELDLKDDIIEISESYMFNTLFVKARKDIKKKFEKAPGVKDITTNDSVLQLN